MNWMKRAAVGAAVCMGLAGIPANVLTTSAEALAEKQSTAVWKISNEKVVAKGGETTTVEVAVSVSDDTIGLNSYLAKFKINGNEQTALPVSVQLRQGDTAYHDVTLYPAGELPVRGLLSFGATDVSCGNWTADHGTVFYITFEIPEAGNISFNNSDADGKYAVYDIMWDNLDAINSGKDEENQEMFRVVPQKLTNGSIKVYQPGTSISDQSDFLLGDVNQDGVVNANDATLILIASAKLGTGSATGLEDVQEKAADVNGDNIINANDATVVLKYAAAVGTGKAGDIRDYI